MVDRDTHECPCRRATDAKKERGGREREWASERVRVRAERSGGDTKPWRLTLGQEVTAEGEKDERLRGIWELTGRSKVKS